MDGPENIVLPHVGVVFDLDGTLIDSSFRDEAPNDLMELMADAPLEPVYSEARAWEKKSLNVDVVYLSGRDQQLWTVSKLWLSKHKLFGKCICRPPDVPEEDTPMWKAAIVASLVAKHNWTHVTVYENDEDNLRLIMEALPPRVVIPTLVREADGEKQVPESNLTGLPEQDIINLKILMGRLSPEDPSWKSLLIRKWPSRTALLDSAQDYITGKHQRRLFRQLVDEIWMGHRA
jgi:hypothetical protein